MKLDTLQVSEGKYATKSSLCYLFCMDICLVRNVMSLSARLSIANFITLHFLEVLLLTGETL